MSATDKLVGGIESAIGDLINQALQAIGKAAVTALIALV
jgi:hypothetical protein